MVGAWRTRGGRAATLPDHFRSDTLTHFAFRLRILKESIVTVGMSVDKPRRDYATGSVDYPARRLTYLAELSNALPENGNVSVKPRRPGAIDKAGVLD